MSRDVFFDRHVGPNSFRFICIQTLKKILSIIFSHGRFWGGAFDDLTLKMKYIFFLMILIVLSIYAQQCSMAQWLSMQLLWLTFG